MVNRPNDHDEKRDDCKDSHIKKRKENRNATMHNTSFSSSLLLISASMHGTPATLSRSGKRRLAAAVRGSVLGDDAAFIIPKPGYVYESLQHTPSFVGVLQYLNSLPALFFSGLPVVHAAFH